MKVGIGSRDLFLRWGDDRYKMGKKYGFDIVDCRLMTRPNDEIYTLPEKEIMELHRKERAMADDAGVELPQAHATMIWPPKDSTKEERAETLRKMTLSLRGAQILGVKYWAVHPMLPVGYEDLGTDQEHITTEVNLEFFEQLLPVARECDIVMCLENMPLPKYSMASPDAVHKFLNYFNDDHFKMCLDTGHNNIATDISAGDQVRAHRDVLRALHVHDNGGRADEHRLPYHGTVDWEDFARALKEIDFPGNFVYETGPSQDLPSPYYEEMLMLQRRLAETIIDVK